MSNSSLTFFSLVKVFDAERDWIWGADTWASSLSTSGEDIRLRGSSVNLEDWRE